MIIHRYFHFISNLIIQILLGIPLECVHGSLRITKIYLLGIIFASLSTYVFNRIDDLIGASAGVFAIITAHLANVIIVSIFMKLLFYLLITVFKYKNDLVSCLRFDKCAAF